jgi:hypothetical protein
MKTQIYSCGKGTTSLELTDSFTTCMDVWFPEVVQVGRGLSIPLHEHEQLALLPDLIGKSIITVSETIILMFLREVRKGRIMPFDLELYCNGRRIEVSDDGSLLDMWDGGFFETGFDLRFSE